MLEIDKWGLDSNDIRFLKAIIIAITIKRIPIADIQFLPRLLLPRDQRSLEENLISMAIVS